MPISKGQIIFAVIFFICFVAAMVWAYLKDRKVDRIYYKGVYMVLIGMIAFIAVYNLALRFLNK